jgi:hypothetical protein
MASALFGIVRTAACGESPGAIVAAGFVTALTNSARAWGARDDRHRAAARNGRRRAHPCERGYTEWRLRFAERTVPFRKHIPVRRRIMEGLLVATSLVLLWLIILAIDGRAGTQVAAAVKSGVATNGGVASQLSDSASYVTRSAWELSFIYGPLMTFAAIAAVLLFVMNRTTK